MSKLYISTTGTLSPVPCADIGKLPGFVHPLTNYEVTDEFSIYELIESGDFLGAITSGHIEVSLTIGGANLTATELQNVLITPGHAHSAQDTSFDNSSTNFPGAPANVQDAIEAVDSRLDILEVIEAYYGEINITGNATSQNLAVVDTWYDLVNWTANGGSNGVTPDYAASKITIDNNGTYLITFTADLQGESNKVYEYGVFVNGISTPHAGLLGKVQPSSAGAATTLSLSGVLENLVATDSVKIRIRNRTGANVTFTIVEGNLFVTSLSGKGPKGDQGAVGSGSNVTIKDGGTPVANTPHATINFIGASVSDAGAGQVNVEFDSVFGAHFTQVADATETSTTSATPVDRLTLTSPSIPAGKYRVSASFALYTSNTAKSVGADLFLDSTTIIMKWEKEAAYASRLTGFTYVDLSSGVHTFTLRYYRVGANATAYIKNIQIDFWRVP